MFVTFSWITSCGKREPSSRIGMSNPTVLMEVWAPTCQKYENKNISKRRNVCQLFSYFLFFFLFGQSSTLDEVRNIVFYSGAGTKT